MPPQIASVAFAFLIIGLFVLDRDRKARTSKALWIPLAWLFMTASRPVSAWLDTKPVVDSPEKYLDGSPRDAALFGFLMVAGLTVLLGRRRRVFAILRENWPILLFLFYCALSTLWSDYTFVAFKRWTKEVGEFVMVIIVLTDLEPTAALKRLLARMAFLIIPLSVLFIKYYPNLGRSYNIWTYTPMYCGITTNKNGLGMICLVYGLGCLWCFLSAFGVQKSSERTRRLVAHGMILTMVLWLLHMSNSMTSIACFILAGGLMTLASLSRVARKPSSVHLLVATAVGVTFAALFLGLGGGALQTMGRDATLTGRTAIWSIVLSVAGNPVLGTGFESFWLGDRLQRVWDIFGLHIQEAHNGYLEVYLNLGWIGVTMLAILIVTGYRNVIRALRAKQDASLLKLGFFVSGVIYSFTEAGFRMMSPIWTAFILAIIAVPMVSAPQDVIASSGEALPEFADLGPELEYIPSWQEDI